MTENYLMGSKMDTWKESDVKNITFVVTEDCNLLCKYCYITGKNKDHKMTFETAKKAVDYILNNQEEFPQSSVIWEFIGGEPFLAIELIDQITDYIKKEMFRLDHKWFDSYRFNMATNGVLYADPKVQQYIKKNLNNLSIGISIDGNKTKHDLQRVKADGSGSYDDVVKNVPLWLEQYPNSGTKATFAHDDLIHLKDSVLSLYGLGIKNIPANVIFEDDWQEGDDLILENQLRELADHIIDNGLWNEFNCTMFSDSIGSPLNEDNLKHNWCGAGKMLAVDYQGKFYPCVRFIGYSLNKREGYVVGDIDNGYDHDKLRPFLVLNLEKQSPQKCIDCQVATGCAWCQGLNYDEARIDTIYERATYICDMHKARVRANDYYWAKLKRVAGIERKNSGIRKDHLYLMLSNKATRHCTYTPDDSKEIKMDLDILKKGLEYARYNFYTPVLMVPAEGLTVEQKELIKDLDVLQIHSGGDIDQTKESILVYDNRVEEILEGDIGLMLVKPKNFQGLAKNLQKLFGKYPRVNLVVEEANKITNEDLAIYEEELIKMAEYLTDKLSEGVYLELNVLSDMFNLDKMANCNAGVDSYTLAPNGEFFICPAFYYDNSEAIGTIEDGVTFDYQDFLRLDKSPICTACDAYHCRRCVYLNKKQTKEFLIPGKTQCVISHVERKVGRKYAGMLDEKNILKQITSRTIDQIFPEIDYYDPFERVVINLK